MEWYVWIVMAAAIAMIAYVVISIKNTLYSFKKKRAGKDE